MINFHLLRNPCQIRNTAVFLILKIEYIYTMTRKCIRSTNRLIIKLTYIRYFHQIRVRYNDHEMTYLQLKNIEQVICSQLLATVLESHDNHVLKEASQPYRHQDRFLRIPSALHIQCIQIHSKNHSYAN